MKGWKTKLGAIFVAVGGACLAGAKVIPDPVVAPWLTFVGVVLTTMGGGTAAWGLGHKIEKATTNNQPKKE